MAQVLRKGEAQRFQQHTELGNRRLLWHGTNVAVVATVLKTGLRIMPHSGGRVGRLSRLLIVLSVYTSHSALPCLATWSMTILRFGVLVMHSGDARCCFVCAGRGIYLASELSKSAGYTQCGQQKGKPIGVLFLAEAALGDEHSIVRDDPSLESPPKGGPSDALNVQWGRVSRLCKAALPTPVTPMPICNQQTGTRHCEVTKSDR